MTRWRQLARIWPTRYAYDCRSTIRYSPHKQYCLNPADNHGHLIASRKCSQGTVTIGLRVGADLHPPINQVKNPIHRNLCPRINKLFYAAIPAERRVGTPHNHNVRLRFAVSQCDRFLR